jgi:hypothetical protein
MSRETREFPWKDREKMLAEVVRYHKIEVMFYRTNLRLHSKRVPRIVKALMPRVLECYPDIDPDLPPVISIVHDDPEIITGDIPLQLKLLMDETAHAEMKQKEIAAAEYLDECYGRRRVRGYRYLDLVMQAILKNSIASQVNSFADKTEGFSEAIHELLAGNMAFLQPVMNYISKTFNDLPGNFPLIKDVFRDGGGGSYFRFPVVELLPYFKDGKIGAFPHTKESIKRNTGILHYELWKKITLEMPGGLELLTKQTEFFPKSS